MDKVNLCAALAVAAAAGCMATYEGTSLDLPEPAHRDTHAVLVVAVREHAARTTGFGTTVGNPKGGAEWLTRGLQGTGRFARVDLESALDCEPDLVLFATEDHEHWGDADAVWLYVGLGALPVVYDGDRGYYFARADREETRFHFDWSQTEVVWWFAYPLTFLSGWHSGPPLRDVERIELFGRFIDEHWSALTEGVTPRGDPKCRQEGK